MNFPEIYKTSVKNMHKGTLPQNSPWVETLIGLLLMIVFSALFGFAVGTYNGGWQLLYTSIKVPALMLITTAFIFPFLTVFTLIFAGQVSFKFIVRSVIFTLTQTSFILFALLPIMWLFIQNGSYRLNILAMAGCFIIAGGYATFRTGVVFDSHYIIAKWRIFLITITCGLIYTFVAGQVWWLMRPWIGYTYQQKELPFIRNLDDNKINNVYDSINLSGVNYYKREILKELDE